MDNSLLLFLFLTMVSLSLLIVSWYAAYNQGWKAGYRSAQQDNQAKIFDYSPNNFNTFSEYTPEERPKEGEPNAEQ